MSLSYGNFSHALNATVDSGTVNGTVCYFTLPWYPASYIENIRVSCTKGTAPTAYSSLAILGNGAHERIGDFTSVDEYVYIDATSVTPSATGNSYGGWILSNPVYFDDKYARPYIHIKLTLTGGAGFNLRLTAQGRKAIGSSYKYTDITGIKKLKDFRVLKSGNGGTVDLTSSARSNNNGSNSSFILNNATDYIMVGSENKVDHWDFGVSTGSTNAMSLTGELWNGSAWSAFTVLDNTAATATSTMRYSGVVEGYGIGTSTWERTKLATDPLTIYENALNAGTERAIGMFYNPERYWARFKLTSISDTVNFKYILPVEDVY